MTSTPRFHWIKIIVWSLVGFGGAVALAILAWSHGEPVNAPWLVVAAVAVFTISYQFRSGGLMAKILTLDELRAAPAVAREDGKDFVHTNRRVVFGHHFAAIGGPGPLVGPVLAALFGYLPGLLWILPVAELPPPRQPDRRPRNLHFMKAVIFLTSLLAGSAGAFEYRNPVRTGDFPDPSVIRVGEDYWATATSSEWAPHFPLLHSRDLVNWELTGPVFAQAPAWAKSNFWAPEISEDKGNYFIYYVARHRETDRLTVAVATAPSPGGPYTDHGPLVSEAEGSIDAAPFTDTEGVRWLVWKNDGNSVRKPTTIWIQRLSDDGLKLVGERREILTNDTPWEGAVVEGPFVLRRGDYYYLFYSGGACCGRECDYALGVARAKNVLGPWEKAPANPLLAANAAWRCPGHGSIVTDPQGRCWLLYHSYAQEGFVATGRQLLLDEVVFGADGWPTINGGRGPSTRAQAPAAARAQADTTVFRDDFTGPRLAAGWQWQIGPRPDAKLDDGRLMLTGAGGMTGVVQSIRTPSFVAETIVDASRLGSGDFAGIVIYGDRANGIQFLTDGKGVQVRSRRKQKDALAAEARVEGGRPVALRVACVDGNRFRFAVRDPDGAWREVGGETSGAYLPPWDRGVRIGLGLAGKNPAQAGFAYFTLAPDGIRLLAP